MSSHGVARCRENTNNFLNTVLKWFAVGTIFISVGGFALPYVTPVTPQSVIGYYLFVTVWALIFGVIAIIRVNLNYNRVIGILATTLTFLVVYLFVYDRFYMGIIENIERFI